MTLDKNGNAIKKNDIVVAEFVVEDENETDALLRTTAGHPTKLRLPANSLSLAGSFFAPVIEGNVIANAQERAIGAGQVVETGEGAPMSRILDTGAVERMREQMRAAQNKSSEQETENK